VIQADDEAAQTVSHLRDSVLIRVRTEEELSFGARFRDMFTDMRLLWPALGATSAVTVALALALSVLHSTTLERPESLATMLETLSDPGGDRNPLMPGNSARVDRLFLRYVDSDRAGGISMPRALDDGTVFESIPEQDATFAVAAVVSREGRIANYELLKSERSGRQGGNLLDDVEMLDAKLRQSRFAPAQTPVGRAVAVNMVWLIVNLTVQTPPEPRAIRVPPAVAPTNRIPPAEAIEETPLKRSDRLETSTTA